MAGSPMGGFDLDVRDVRSMAAAASCSQLNVPALQFVRVHQEVERDDFTGHFSVSGGGAIRAPASACSG